MQTGMSSGIHYANTKARKKAAKIRRYGRMSKRGVRAWQPSTHEERPVKVFYLHDIDADQLRAGQAPETQYSRNRTAT